MVPDKATMVQIVATLSNFISLVDNIATTLGNFIAVVGKVVVPASQTTSQR
jgi:hypothetical protein